MKRGKRAVFAVAVLLVASVLAVTGCQNNVGGGSSSGGSHGGGQQDGGNSDFSVFEITPLSVQVDESEDLVINIAPSDGVTYTAVSGDPSVATVSVNGSNVAVTGKKDGTTTVSVTAKKDGYNSMTVTATVTVTLKNFNSLTVSPASVEVKSGESTTLTVSSDPSGEGVTYTAVPVDASKAEVTVSGSTVTVTGAGHGTTTVSVTAKKSGYNDKTITANVTVELLNMKSIPNKNFAMSETEITQKQYEAIMGNNPSNFNGTSGKEAASGEVQKNRPVENVSWYDTLVFCNKLSISESRTPCYTIDGKTNPDDWGAVPTSYDDTWNVQVNESANGYRLPTETEWKFAAKGGIDTNRWAGTNVESELENYAWYTSNSNSKTHEVKKKSPNGYGLYDMSGNVWEWCWSSSGSNRVYCGGSCGDGAAVCAVSYRDVITPFIRYSLLGFRVVRGN